VKAKKLRSCQKIARAEIVTFQDAILAMEAQMQIAKLRTAGTHRPLKCSVSESEGRGI